MAMVRGGDRFVVFAQLCFLLYLQERQFFLI
jgi:hypothetical protein